MMRGLFRLLSGDAPVLRRYLALALVSGVLNGLTIAAIAPVLAHLLRGDGRGGLPWLGAVLAGAVLCWLWRRRVERAGVDVGLAVLGPGRERIGDHVARLPPGWFTAANTARLNHVITHGVMEVAQLPAHVFTPVLSGMAAPVVVALALFAFDWRMGLLALLALPLMAAVFVLAARLGRRADAEWHESAADAGARAAEFARSQAVLRAFGSGTRFLDAASDRQHRTGASLIRLSVLSVVLNGWLVQAVFAVLVILGAQGLAAGIPPDAVIGAVVSLILANRFAEPLLDVAGYGEALRGARGHLDAIDAILSAAPLPEPAVPQAPQDASVALDSVTFRYAPDLPTVLTGVSFRAAPGEIVALAGASGSGKSTVLRLIARFFDPEAGSLRFGGTDLRRIGSDGVTAAISQIFQENWLFSGTLRENILLGREGATEAELSEAIRLAGVEEIVARLPEGLETQVGEGGGLLSGGERQRIAIARALIKRAPLLLVDEATAALDAGNEAAITRMLAGMRGKVTIIVVAHRPAALSLADRVVVLDRGRVVMEGSPAELRAAGDHFARHLGLPGADRPVARSGR